MSNTMEQLSSGKRINGAKDDAAGLAISNKMTSQIRGLDQAVRNANDGISMLQTAEGGLVEITNMLQRMRELAVQSANDTNTSSDRIALDDEFADLSSEIDRIAQMTQFNGMGLSDGKVSKSTAAATQIVKFQVGANKDQTIDVNLKNMRTGTGGGLSTVKWVTGTAAAFNVRTQTNANNAIDTITTAIATVDTERSNLGAKVNRLNYAADNLANVSMNTSAARSRVLDTDYAKATTDLARSQIIQQAATAMLAQANQQPASVLSLLQ